MTEVSTTTGRFAERSSMQEDWVARAYAAIPGGTTNSIVPIPGKELVIDHGEGPWLVDIDGRRFMDFALGAGPLVLGHAHPRIVETLQRSALRGTTHFELHYRTIELAERLIQYIPSSEQVRFTSSGTEATFHALRLARAVTGRSSYIKFDGAWHGHHDLATWNYEGGTLFDGSPRADSGGIQPGVRSDITVLPYNDADAVVRELTSHPTKYAAVIMEPYQRALTAVPGYLQAVRDACDKTGTVLIFDEVVTGFRLSPGGVQEIEGVTPDLTTLGKAISGGLPLSAVVGKKEFMDHFRVDSNPDQFSFHCGTLNGYLHAVEASHTTLDIMVEEGGIARLNELGEYVRAGLKQVFDDRSVATQVVGAGGLFHAFFTDSPVRDTNDQRKTDIAYNARLHDNLRAAGVYKTSSKGYLSIVHDEDMIDDLLAKYEWAADNV